jgi:HlyD family secretion protein
LESFLFFPKPFLITIKARIFANLAFYLGTMKYSGISYHLLLGVLLVASALTACKKETKIEITTSTVRTITARVSESGIIQPDLEVPIAPDVSGEVTALYVKEGDFVTRGQLLFEIRPDNYRAALEQTSASLNTAKADYANAIANRKQAQTTLIQDSVNFARNEQLFRDKVIPQTDYENFRLRYQVAKSTVEAAMQAEKAAYFRVQSAEASVKRSNDDLSRTRVYASMDGTITLLNIKLGQRVVGTGMMSGTETMKIADLSRMKVKVNINENDVVSLRIGDTASIEVDALKGKKFRGTVTDIAYSAKVAEVGTTDQVTNYEVKVMIDPESYRSDSSLMRGLMPHQSPLRPGMSAVVNIYTKRVNNAVAVPIQCVTIDRERQEENAKETREIVFLYDSTTKIVSTQPVVSGISDDEFIEIKTGLKAGQVLVSGPYNVITKELKNQMKVGIRNEKDKKADAEKKE